MAYGKMQNKMNKPVMKKPEGDISSVQTTKSVCIRNAMKQGMDATAAKRKCGDSAEKVV